MGQSRKRHEEEREDMKKERRNKRNENVEKWLLMETKITLNNWTEWNLKKYMNSNEKYFEQGSSKSWNDLEAWNISKRENFKKTRKRNVKKGIFDENNNDDVTEDLE